MGVVRFIHVLVWGPWTLVLFLATGLLFTIRSGGFQVRGLPAWWRATVGSLRGDISTYPERRQDTTTLAGPPAALPPCPPAAPPSSPPAQPQPPSVTPFQSACTALAATIGTGNIVGVATALTAGGPGAILWMWVCGLIGMATAYAETSLGQQYRYRKPDGHWMCGPMVTMERGLGCPALGFLYAGFALLASLGMGSMVQSNSMSGNLEFCAGIPPLASAGIVTALTAAVVLGGIGRISLVAERLMPVSAGVYMGASLLVLLFCRDALIPVMGEILADGLRPQAAGGGLAGFFLSRSVRYGMSRGVFSNEAGLGSLAVLHGAAEQTEPERQGMWAMFEVFFDTIVICTMTALVILCASRKLGVPAGLDGAALASWCYASCLGAPGRLLVPVAMTVFAFATIIAWYYLGRQTAAYLLGKWSASPSWLCLYTMLYLAAVFLGCLCRLELVWLAADIWNGLMAYPNLLALWLLQKEVRFPQSCGRKKRKKEPLRE